MEPAGDNQGATGGVDTEPGVVTNPVEKVGSKVSDNDDPMLSFLSLLSKVEKASCANCETKDSSPMFFCNTCGQAICTKCREETHRSKMFTLHDVTSISSFTKEPQRKCTVHNEIYIMYSPANESLLCINCFRDLSADIRSQCVDLESSYAEHCGKLQKSIRDVNETEIKLKDEVTAYHNQLKNLHMNAMREESTIHVFSKILHGTITETEEKLIDSLKRELQLKERALNEKLHTLEQLQNNIQAYLSLTTAFIGSASKYELLKLAGGLVERLNSISSLVQPFTISSESSSLQSNFKSEFAQNLRCLLQQECWNTPPIEPTPQSTEAAEEKKTTTQLPVEPLKKPLFKSHSLPNISLESFENPDSSTKKPKLSNHTSKPPLPKKEKKLRKSRTVDRKDPNSRSKSSEGPSNKNSIHQMELFATIQSRKAVSNNGSKNLFVTSMVGVRQSENSKPSSGQDTLPSVKTASKSQSGHVCVVQAMVHQDGATPTDPKPAGMRSFDRHSDSGPRLTQGQLQELMRAICAARSVQDTDRNADKSSKKPLKRTDSFEGHEDAVRMLVDAVQELRQICCSKGSCEHL